MTIKMVTLLLAAFLSLTTISSAQYCGFAVFNVIAQKNKWGKCVMNIYFRVSLGARFTETLSAAHTGGYFVNHRTLGYRNILTPGNRPQTLVAKKRYKDSWKFRTDYGKVEIGFPYIRASSSRSRGQFCYGALPPGYIEIDSACSYVKKKFRTNLRLKKGDDVVFVIDNTGSMADDIAAVKVSASNIVNSIAASKSWRVGFVFYNDPAAGMLLDFTNDRKKINATIQALGASGGGDLAEHVYSGLKTALDMDWRPEASRTIITMGDAPPKDPEPGTGLTEARILTLANSINVRADVTPSVRALMVRNALRGVENGLKLKYGSERQRGTVTLAVPVKGGSPLMMVAVGGQRAMEASFSRLADGTDGRVFPAENATEVVEAIVEAIEETIPPPASCTGAVIAPKVEVKCRDGKKAMCIQNKNKCSIEYSYVDNFSGLNGDGKAGPGESCIEVEEQGGTVWFDFSWYNPKSGGKWIRDTYTSSTCV